LATQDKDKNTNNSGPQNRSKKPYNRRRRKNFNNKKSATTSNENKDKQAKPDDPKKSNNRSFSNRRRNNNKNRNRNKNQKANTPERLQIKHENLQEQYVQARHKFFHQYGKTSEKQKLKALKNYEKCLEDLRRFESNLRDWQKEALKEKLDFYPEDRQFSSEHDLPKEGEIVSFSGDFPDPHLLETQAASNYKNDTEESTGTMDDYQKYKESI